MEVTKANFADLLPVIERSINECIFMSMDTEFTGLSLGAREDVMDTAQLRYQKARKTAQNFVVTQFGLTTWRISDRQYISETWNFYLFSHPFGKVDKRFVCQSSSIQYLAQHNFDFNKFIYSGIPYMNLAQEESEAPVLERDIDQLRHYEEDPPPDIVVTQPRDIEFVEALKESVDAWLRTDKEQPLIVTATNSFLRRLVYQEIRNKYPDLVVEKIWGEWDRLVVREVTREQRQQLLEEKIAKKRAEFETAIGFRRVIEMMCRSGKPLVGHNMFLDLMYLYELFHRDLPMDCSEWQVELHKLYPQIYDTKYLALFVPGIKDRFLATGLGDLYKDIGQMHKIAHAEGHSRYKEGEDYAHEAGYDAFMTGSVFLGLVSLILGKEPDSEGVNLSDASLQKHGNKLNLYGLDHFLDIMDMNNTRDMGHVFHLQFNAKISGGDIFGMFFQIPIQIKWINGTSAFVLVADRSKLPSIYSRLRDGSFVSPEKAAQLNLRIRPYELYRKEALGPAISPLVNSINGIVATAIPFVAVLLSVWLQKQ